MSNFVDYCHEDAYDLIIKHFEEIFDRSHYKINILSSEMIPTWLNNKNDDQTTDSISGESQSLIKIIYLMIERKLA